MLTFVACRLSSFSEASLPEAHDIKEGDDRAVKMRIVSPVHPISFLLPIAAADQDERRRVTRPPSALLELFLLCDAASSQRLEAIMSLMVT